MGQIVQINIRPDRLIEVLSMTVLHCRQEIHRLSYDEASVLEDIDEYRRLIRAMDTALELLEAVGSFSSTEFVRISGDGERCEDGVTLEMRRREQEDDD
jgi:hypothetical protein